MNLETDRGIGDRSTAGRLIGWKRPDGIVIRYTYVVDRIDGIPIDMRIHPFQHLDPKFALCSKILSHAATLMSRT